MHQVNKFINNLRPEKNQLLVIDKENISRSLFEWCQLLEHKEQTVLLIEDGMNAETLRKIFDPFITTKPEEGYSHLFPYQVIDGAGGAVVRNNRKPGSIV